MKKKIKFHCYIACYVSSGGKKKKRKREEKWKNKSREKAQESLSAVQYKRVNYYYNRVWLEFLDFYLITIFRLDQLITIFN